MQDPAHEGEPAKAKGLMQVGWKWNREWA